MEFILGILFIFPLIGIMLAYDRLKSLVPPELAVQLVYSLILLDGVMVAIWYYGILPILANIKVFKLGICWVLLREFLGNTLS